MAMLPHPHADCKGQEIPIESESFRASVPGGPCVPVADSPMPMVEDRRFGCQNGGGGGGVDSKMWDSL